MLFKRGILLTISILSFFVLFAQEKEDQFYSLKVKKLLDEIDLNYSITKYNNFKIELLIEEKPQRRTQNVYVYSKTENYDGYETREIVSRSLSIPKSEAKSIIFFELLKENGKLKTGSWSIIESDSSPDVYIILFTVKVSTNILAEDLFSVISFVAREADSIEKLYTSGLDKN